jgi:hypothetical protein
VEMQFCAVEVVKRGSVVVIFVIVTECDEVHLKCITIRKVCSTILCFKRFSF